MATKTKATVLSVSIRESMLKDGRVVANTTTKRIPNIKNSFERNITCKGGVETTLYEVSTDRTTHGSKFDVQSIKYARISNRDSSKNVRLRIANSGSDELIVNLHPGDSYQIFQHKDNTIMSTSAVTTYAMLSITSVKAQPLTSNDVDVQIFVASK
jgi:hypothetical protein